LQKNWSEDCWVLWELSQLQDVQAGVQVGFERSGNSESQILTSLSIPLMFEVKGMFSLMFAKLVIGTK